MSGYIQFWADVQIVPLQPLPAQVANVTLSGQSVTLNVRASSIQVPEHLPGQIAVDPPNYVPIVPVFVDVYLNGSLLIGGVLARQGVRIVRDAYFGFVGDLVWYDSDPDPTIGPIDPFYQGIGTRFQLTYWPFLVGFGANQS